MPLGVSGAEGGGQDDRPTDPPTCRITIVNKHSPTDKQTATRTAHSQTTREYYSAQDSAIDLSGSD